MGGGACSTQMIGKFKILEQDGEIFLNIKSTNQTFDSNQFCIRVNDDQIVLPEFCSKKEKLL